MESGTLYTETPRPIAVECVDLLGGCTLAFGGGGIFTILSIPAIWSVAFLETILSLSALSFRPHLILALFSLI